MPAFSDARDDTDGASHAADAARPVGIYACGHGADARGGSRMTTGLSSVEMGFQVVGR